MDTLTLILALPTFLCIAIGVVFTALTIPAIIHSACTNRHTMIHWLGDTFQIDSDAWKCMLYCTIFSSVLYILLFGFDLVTLPGTAQGMLFGVPNTICCWYIIWVIDYNWNVRK